MFGLIRYKTFANQTLHQISWCARATQIALQYAPDSLPSHRFFDEMVLYARVLAIFTPPGKINWVLAQFKNIKQECGEGLSFMVNLAQERFLQMARPEDYHTSATR